MFSKNKAQQTAREFVNSLHPSLKALAEQTEQQLSQFLQATFTKMNLITKEEYDIQCEVLAKTRLKLEQIEKKLTDFEKKLSP